MTYLSGIFAGVWVLIAFLNPENDYLLFPILIAGAVPVSYRISLRGPVDLPTAVGGAIAGLFTVALTVGLLTFAGKLQGPGALPFGSSLVDVLVLGSIGAAVGVLIAVVPIGTR